MDRLERNKNYLRSLYEAKGPRLGLITRVKQEYSLHVEPYDYTLSDAPLEEWVPPLMERYEKELSMLEKVEDDNVPFINLCRNTGIFAAAFGCRLHIYDGMGVPAASRPLVKTPAEAAKLAKPSLESPTLSRSLRLAEILSREAGPDVPVSVPDIQSPFGIAAMIWDKAELMVAMVNEPEAVKELGCKCHELLKEFLLEFRRLVPNCTMCHCPPMWVPKEYGCHLSEDEIGIISPDMFDEFCLPSLKDLSKTFHGIWIHCCADADHQYAGLKKIPELRGLNRRFIRGPEKCIEMFSDTALFSMGCTSEQELMQMLDIARPNSRFLFVFDCDSLHEAQGLTDRFRERFPR